MFLSQSVGLSVCLSVSTITHKLGYQCCMKLLSMWHATHNNCLNLWDDIAFAMGESLDWYTIRPVLGYANRRQKHDNQQRELSIIANQKLELPNDVIQINVWLPSDWQAYITSLAFSVAKA